MRDDSSMSLLNVPSAFCLHVNILEQLQRLNNDAYEMGAKDGRRSIDRFSIPYTFFLTPINSDGTLLKNETTLVTGKDMSLSGIAFSHDLPIPFHRVLLVLLDRPQRHRYTMEADIIWTRKTTHGNYESGGRLRWIVPEEVVPEDN